MGGSALVDQQQSRANLVLNRLVAAVKQVLFGAGEQRLRFEEMTLQARDGFMQVLRKRGASAGAAPGGFTSSLKLEVGLLEQFELVHNARYEKRGSCGALSGVRVPALPVVWPEFVRGF